MMMLRRVLPVLALAGLSAFSNVATATSASAEMRTWFIENRQMVRIMWTGRIQKPMARQLKRVIKKWHGKARNGFELVLNSRGGKVREGRDVSTRRFFRA